MVIFNDPVYLYLALGGGIVSLGGLIHDVVENETIQNRYKIFWEALKALLFGVILTPMIFILYVNAGDKMLSSFFENLFSVKISDISSMLNSFWFLGAIFTSWYILPLWTFFLKKIVGGGEKNGK
jgi:hypothetical protein